MWTEDGQNGPSGPHVLPRAVEDSHILSGLAPALLLRMKGKTAVEKVSRCDCVNQKAPKNLVLKDLAPDVNLTCVTELQDSDITATPNNTSMRHICDQNRPNLENVTSE